MGMEIRSGIDRRAAGSRVSREAPCLGSVELDQAPGAAVHGAECEADGEARTRSRALLDRLESVFQGSGLRSPPDLGFSVHYQPIVELVGRATRGFEALIRWHDPAYGQVPAAELIELAERSDLIVSVGDWVMRTALRDAGRMTGSRYEGVNVAAAQLLEPGFAERTRRLIAVAGFDPARLVLEITESRVVEDHERVWEELADLRGMGVRIAIDDYGTGYSSLAYLRHPVIGMVKLDKTLLRGVTDLRSRVILRSVVALMRALEIDLVAGAADIGKQRHRRPLLRCPHGAGVSLRGRDAGGADARMGHRLAVTGLRMRRVVGSGCAGAAGEACRLGFGRRWLECGVGCCVPAVVGGHERF